MYIIFHHFISTLCHFFNWPQVFTHQSIRNEKMKRKKKRQIVLLLFQDCFASFCKMLTHVIPTDNNVTTSISTHSNIWNKQIFMLSAESSVSIALVNWYLTKYIYESYISGRNDRWPQKFTLYKSFFFFIQGIFWYCNSMIRPDSSGKNEKKIHWLLIITWSIE